MTTILRRLGGAMTMAAMVAACGELANDELTQREAAVQKYRCSAEANNVAFRFGGSLIAAAIQHNECLSAHGFYRKRSSPQATPPVPPPTPASQVGPVGAVGDFVNINHTPQGAGPVSSVSGFAEGAGPQGPSGGAVR